MCNRYRLLYGGLINTWRLACKENFIRRGVVLKCIKNLDHNFRTRASGVFNFFASCSGTILKCVRAREPLQVHLFTDCENRKAKEVRVSKRTTIPFDVKSCFSGICSLLWCLCLEFQLRRRKSLGLWE